MSTTTMTAAAVADDGAMSPAGPRGDRPRRRSWTRAEKIEHVVAYRAAREVGNGNGYLREHAIYSSTIGEWMRAVDAGTLSAGTAPVGTPSADQAEIARLRRELEVTRNRLATTETALDIMGRCHTMDASGGPGMIVGSYSSADRSFSGAWQGVDSGRA